MKRALNVGSGQRRFHDPTGEIEWCNVDKVSRQGHEPDWIEDGAHLPCGDETVDYFALVQVLEHFGCGEGADLIKEAHRVLKPGGSLIISVPDLRAICTEWLHGERLDTQLFMTCLYGAYMGSEEDRHKWGFDNESLGSFLTKTGPWKAILFRNFPDIPGSSFPHDWWILEVECVK
jgi:SAM-dependent methyltransferase